MLPKYTVEYALRVGRHDHPNHYGTDDPVACEEFVAGLLDSSHKIRGIRHEGLDLSKPEFDKIVRSAAGIMASRHVCASLEIDSDEAHVRFGTPA